MLSLFVSLHRIFYFVEELLELFESVHFALFFVMVLFVAKVLGLVSDGILTEAEWLELDRSCRDEEYIKQLTRRYIDARKRPQTIAQKIKSCLAATFPSLRSRRNDTIVDQLNFYAMRREFILERSVEPPFKAADEKNRVPEDFNFGRYLSISLGQTLAHSVHLGVSTWLFIGLFTVLFFFVILALDEDIVVSAVRMEMISQEMCIVNESTLSQTRASISHPIDTEAVLGMDRSGLYSSRLKSCLGHSPGAH